MHFPVLRQELISMMNIDPHGTYVDCTGGGGGHAEYFIKQLSSGLLIILDRDLDAVERLNIKFKDSKNVKVFHANFKDLDLVLDELGISSLSGLYADFGLSSFQIKHPERGFSFMNDGPLDMRMDSSQGVTAADVVNTYSASDLQNIILKFGEERFHRKISDAIVKRRTVKPFEFTVELAETIKSVIPKKLQKVGIHPATQTFQALRIYVNQELESIDTLLNKQLLRVAPGGRVAFISFHSLEDRLVKHSLNNYSSSCVCPPTFPICICDKRQDFIVINKKPIIPSESEISANPASRSAKLRVAERV